MERIVYTSKTNRTEIAQYMQFKTLPLPINYPDVENVNAK